MTPTIELHTMTPEEVRRIVALERQRCLLLVLAEVGRQRLAGRYDVAAVLGALATRMEQEPEKVIRAERIETTEEWRQAVSDGLRRGREGQ